ncbi:Integrator complex subunit 6 [Fasciola hepatica]|uniref:Integrator complex subunit 6 n=1 Tax=Fasciola hepatica TaxID=6192 RepID=A0A4E0RAH3_FASHE|nr:Integrator complex subunit 6 [Fasciola hepatica]
MTIIVFLIDNSASMNQRTVQGTTLLDIAKTATELFFKIRMGKSRVDRYFILTLDAECNYIKLVGNKTWIYKFYTLPLTVSSLMDAFLSEKDFSGHSGC